MTVTVAVLTIPWTSDGNKCSDAVGYDSAGGEEIRYGCRGKVHGDRWVWEEGLGDRTPWSCWFPCDVVMGEKRMVRYLYYCYYK